MTRQRKSKQTTNDTYSVQQRGNGNIGIAKHSGSGDNVAGGKTVSGKRSSPPAPSTTDDAEQPSMTPRRISSRALAASIGAILSAVVSALINLLTASWSWWIFAIAAALLLAVAIIVYVVESVAHR
ncbi:hypothetical protein [Nonomuraea sp. NEAU-A123]|uniref:hypothetical protein n=1 Tax=Nonomuraea sp. NEAU-A123 TaxID=2839649 RepID=UPI001BE3DF0E|nr:hypothetical protein [Nonomuraea sp. NEAU-A123]MBT2234781.1 hypothetical protein [Nonomuraea sp. NEAU-A123]